MNDTNRTAFRLVPLTDRHVAGMLRIFNHYVADGFAAYPEEAVSEPVIAGLLRQTEGYPAVGVEEPTGKLLGFGFLRPYSPHSTFAETALITYFVDGSRTRQGIGTTVLRDLIDRARGQGITKILAHVSSRNPASLAFHAKHGFVECGRFPKIGRKRGEPFDVVWMIKALTEDDST